MSLSLILQLLSATAMAEPTQAHREAVDLAPLVGRWQQLTTREGRPVILEECHAAEVPGIQIERNGAGYRLTQLDTFDAMQYDVLGARREGEVYTIKVLGADGLPRILELAVAGQTASVRWRDAAASPMSVASPSSTFPKISQPESECE